MELNDSTDSVTSGIIECTAVKNFVSGSKTDEIDIKEFKKDLERVVLRKLELGREPSFLLYPGSADVPGTLEQEHSSDNQKTGFIKELIMPKCYGELAETSVDPVEVLGGLPEAYGRMIEEEYLDRKYTIFAVSYKRREELQTHIQIAEDALASLRSSAGDSTTTLRSQARDVFQRRARLKMEVNKWEKEAESYRSALEDQVRYLTNKLSFKKKEYDDLIFRLNENTTVSKSCSDMLIYLFGSRR